MKLAIPSTKAPSSSATLFIGPHMSAARSSTKTVGFTVGCNFVSLSTARIMTSRISVVASPDPAVIPVKAQIAFDATLPMRITRWSL